MIIVSISINYVPICINYKLHTQLFVEYALFQSRFNHLAERQVSGLPVRVPVATGELYLNFAVKMVLIRQEKILREFLAFPILILVVMNRKILLATRLILNFGHQNWCLLMLNQEKKLGFRSF